MSSFASLILLLQSALSLLMLVQKSPSLPPETRAYAMQMAQAAISQTLNQIGTHPAPSITASPSQSPSVAPVVTTAPISTDVTFPIVIGTLNMTGTSDDWREFTASGNTATYTPGVSTLHDMLPWIGYSNCPACSTAPNKQYVALSNLQVGKTYRITLYPAFSSSNMPYEAVPAAGAATITSGQYHVFPVGYERGKYPWVIEFTPSVATVTIGMGNRATAGANYLYIDQMVISGPVTPTTQLCGTLETNHWLATGQEIQPCESDSYKFSYNTNGNLTISNVWTGQILWNSLTNTGPSQKLLMQNDGNLVLYNGATAFWSTVGNAGGKGGQPGVLYIQRDGTAAIIGINDGSILWSSAAAATPATCTFNGQSVASGANVTAYQSSSVASGSSCLSEIRTCSNGNLSGSYQYSACIVAAPSTPSPATVVNQCQPVRTYTYTVPSDVTLACDQGKLSTIAVDWPIHDTGRAFVHASLNLAGSGSDLSAVHGWQSDLVVGSPLYAFQTGEDLCTSESETRDTFGYGTLSAGSQNVSLRMDEYTCTGGSIVLKAGSTVTAYVEDSAPQCQQHDITVKSYNATYGATPVGLTTTARPILTNTITTPAPGTLMLFGSVAPAVSQTTNMCNNRTEYASSFISYNGSLTSQSSFGFAPSQGASHALMSSISTTPNQPAGTVTVGIAAAVNNTYRAASNPPQVFYSNGGVNYYTGTWVDYPTTADTMIASVLLR